jgi:DNA-binding phage protein
MPLTRAFKETVQARAQRDARFREALLTESIETLLSGDIDTGKALMRDYINATIGFGPLAKAIGAEPKSLMRMFGPAGNPTARNLLAVIGHLQTAAGVNLAVRKAG